MPSRCAIWARVSTDEQESGNQLAELRQWAARRGLEVAAEYVVDGASTWKGEHREQLAAALADARFGKYDVLLVWALDRIDREGVESTLGALRRFHEAGAPVWSLKEPWTETADPRLAEPLGAIYAWMAAEESRRRSERVKAGLARRKAEGKPVGRRAAAPRTASRAGAAATTPGGNGNGQWPHDQPRYGAAGPGRGRGRRRRARPAARDDRAG